jgi:ABC-type amino acid transport system permease subunit
MPETPLAEVAHTIQLSVAPVFLLTAIGTILGVLNTRLTRIVDRRRVLVDRMAPLPAAARAPYHDEMMTLRRRRHCVNLALGSGVCAALCVCLLIALAFIGSIIRVDFSRAVAVLFIAAMAGFVSALLLFLREVALAVSRMDVEPR